MWNPVTAQVKERVNGPFKSAISQQLQNHSMLH